MIGELTIDADREERLNEILLAYVEELDAGREPDRERILADHPDLQADLEACFDSRDEFDRFLAPLRAATAQVAKEESLRNDRSDHEQLAGGNDVPIPLGQIGEFRLLREVGRGGMGVVYEAEQVSLQRRVALKVLPFAAAIDDRQLQRFKNEALAASHLQHPHIVPVHAVGCDRGIHYYAMQFIEGQSLAALLAEVRRFEPENAAGSQRDGETPATTVTAHSIARTRSAKGRQYFDWVAQLGRQAALALEHAHRTGVVHRDVKPSNLMLDPQGKLWVTDFGLAQVSGDSSLTVTGELLGTLRYASPEQTLSKRGIVDHRSDLYSLGTTLYELLTLRPPFENSERSALVRRIADEDPLPPRSLNPALPEELETIVLKTLRKEPQDRYATADDLANDLQRYLENRPIQARRPTLVERVRKWGRRHPGVVVTGVVLLLLLSVASILVAAIVRQSYERERRRAEEAEAQFRLARRSVDELIQVSEKELAHRPGMEGLRKRLLTSSLAYYQEFIEQRSDDPTAQAELLDTSKRVETILADLAVLRASSQLYLLAQADVLNDLSVTDDQRMKINGLSARLGKQRTESVRDPRRRSPADRAHRALERARANEAAVNEILTSAQNARLRQIGLQLQGASAFREPEVEAALQLTDAQREQIRSIEEQAFSDSMRTMWPGMSSPGRGSNYGHWHKNPSERIKDLLTSEQRKRWHEMAGDTFKGFSRNSSPGKSPPKGPVY